MKEYKIDTINANKRIDSFLMANTDFSRSKIQELIKDGNVLVNNVMTKNSYKIKENDLITLKEPELKQLDLVPEDMPLDIVYEDNDVIIVNKANGVVVHPALGNNNHTLVNGLLYHSKKLSDVNGEFRPGIVHRIDAYTTGLLMIAKNNKAHELLAKQLEEKTTYRKYVALVWGVIDHDTGTIDAPIGRDAKNRKKMAVTDANSKNAITHFKVLERYKDATLIELSLETGRTHQIRVHMNYIEHPIVNDPVYGRRKLIDDSGQCLHAKELGFIHPSTKEFIKFDSPLPESFINILNQFKNK
ncbi:MAG: RluA family pseudouridine synthase [Bacilli bacterium]|nr:RluA family pseudouridine synthase [Bacilli bacterium]